ncbi:MAG: peptidase T [Synergistaceae bacterium]|nr:peptidase T [Synergistaceae bacterium]
MYTTLEHFLKYIKYDTQSQENAGVIPSTEKQFTLARELFNELQERGLKDVTITEHAYVTGTLPANTDKKIPAIGFISHMDTSPSASGANVQARIINNYDGSNIALNENIILSPEIFPDMRKYVNHDLIVTDGKTLLGADDKAGIAEIIGALDWLLANPEFKHGDMKIAFTPDEEIGELASHLDIKKFAADFAYTVDGGELGEISYENFNAAQAVIKIHGRSVHPGAAKNIMVSAVMLGNELLNMLPSNESPATTEGREGFYHCLSFNCTPEEGEIIFIIRDHDMKKFEARKNFMTQCINTLQEKYNAAKFELSITDQYYNMLEKFRENMYPVDLAINAMKDLQITPVILPIRGGTDGAALSWRGLLTPNIFTGAHNWHSIFEFVSVQVMESASRLIIKILERAAGDNK